MDASEFGGEGRVLGEEPRELGRFVEDAEGMRGALAGRLVLGFGVWFWGLGRIGWVVFFMCAEADDGTTVIASQPGSLSFEAVAKDARNTYYGSEHRGHLYLPSSFSHMPHSFGLGFSGASSIGCS